MSRTNDVTTLLGMHTRAAFVVVAFNVAGVVLAAASTLEGVTEPALVAVAVVLHAVSVAALLRVPGDPIPFGATAAVTLTGPLSCAIVLAALPVPIGSPLQMWPIGTAAGIYTFLCVRGRTWWAWAGFLGIFVVTLVWCLLTAQSAVDAVLYVLPSGALVLMGTFFAFALRSPVTDIFRLREESTRQAAEEAAAAAALHERDLQLTRLDELARPLLTRIASGEPLSDDERLSCRLLEFHLRDTLRAAGLADSEVSSAARAARSRGVDVVLLDDRGADATGVVDRDIVTSVITALESDSTSAVTVRLLPQDRDSAASILVTGADGTHRAEFDRSGTRLSS
ncbi:hypothetical protein [Rhodococcus sp. SORGH_AS_0303]|uniref:hypothetical protein n=1 Tax=Rhodococcus sp. SORGH_AS_0303 TaxID=3041753 RepID=UPI0027866138|nr:hypothetical protein [Rhodococcus sp. SORGH_AS_0303]MDQ1200434.1 hypothetical protein [Rhodococcus sp. SORGH_AS_0303]